MSKTRTIEKKYTASYVHIAINRLTEDFQQENVDGSRIK